MATRKKTQEPKLNTYRAGPDDQGFFGLFGGRFVAETLMPLILELGKAYADAKTDPAYRDVGAALSRVRAARASQNGTVPPRPADAKTHLAGGPEGGKASKVGYL